MKLLITLLITVCSLVGLSAQSMTPLKESLALSPEQHVKSKQIQKETSIALRGIYKLRATICYRCKIQINFNRRAVHCLCCIEKRTKRSV